MSDPARGLMPEAIDAVTRLELVEALSGRIDLDSTLRDAWRDRRISRCPLSFCGFLLESMIHSLP